MRVGLDRGKEQGEEDGNTSGGFERPSRCVRVCFSTMGLPDENFLLFLFRCGISCPIWEAMSLIITLQ